MLMFRELTKEENEIIDKFHWVKGQISNLEIRRLEKEKEIEYHMENKEMDYVPVIVWGLLTLSQAVLVFMDLFFGWWNMGFNLAIMAASLTPFLLLFFGFLFLKSLRKYILRNSKNPKTMQKAKQKGIENKWWHSAQLNDELKQINAQLKMLKKELNYLKLEVDKIEKGS